MSLSRKLKDLGKQLFSAAGFILEKKTPLNTETLLLRHLLSAYQIDCVLDVGANSGQFGKELLATGYRQKLVSFEPLPDAFKALQQRAAGIAQWETENAAVGDFNGEIEINIAANSESSSILPMLDAHRQLAPESAYVGKVTVPIRTLDSFAASRLNTRNILLKIDVQGFESSVLDGAASMLSQVKVLQLELSFLPLYDRGAMYFDMMARLERLGFALYSFLPAFTDYKTGQVFQADAIYTRKK